MSPSIQTRENRARAWEIKFLVNARLAEQIRGWARSRLMPDPNGRGAHGDSYQINSLYFDTDHLDVFHRRGSYGRGKYRIRRYGESDWVFLERKLRTRQQLTKRRVMVGLGDLEQLSEAAPQHDWAGYWFYRRLRLRRLGPVCQVTYDRTARVAMTQYGPIRLTLDSHLCARPADAPRFSAAGGTAFCGDQVILELKFRQAMPTLFKCLVDEVALSPKRLSKYRLAAVALEPDAPAPMIPIADRAYEYA
jgi:hypothetical protein